MSEATAPPTEPQTLPVPMDMFLIYKVSEYF